MRDDAVILAVMVGLAVAVALRIWRNHRLRQRLVRDFLNDPARRERQGEAI